MEPPKKTVEFAYDNIAQWYLDWMQGQKSPRERYAIAVVERLPSTPHVLEIGCGPGVPVLDMLLARGASVIANDISHTQLKIAEQRCSGAQLIAGDMTELSFDLETFDAVMSFYALFHLPRNELRDMLVKIHAWLKPNGFVTFNLATFDDEEIYGEFLGYGMFWSSFKPEHNLEMLQNVGFEVVQKEVLKAGDGELEDGDPDYESSFLWVIAKKRAPPK